MTNETDGCWGSGGQVAEFKVDLRWDEGHRLTDRTITDDPDEAISAFRELLGRPLEGRPVAARLVVEGRSLYYSNFTKLFGKGRIHPDAPIDLSVSRDEADRLAAWLPPAAARKPLRNGEGVGRAAAAASAAASPVLEEAAGNLAAKASGALAYIPRGPIYDDLHAAIEQVVSELQSRR